MAGRPTPPADAGRGAFGAWAERYAEQFLRARGFAFLARNIRYPVGELDLVMAEGQALVFVEVRARRGHSDDVANSLTPSKQRRLRAAARTWLNARAGGRARWPLVRLDFVAISGGEQTTPSVQHIREAWEILPPVFCSGRGPRFGRGWAGLASAYWPALN